MSSPPWVWMVVRRGESAAKCTIRPLRGYPGLEFIGYPLRAPRDFSSAWLLAPGGAPLRPEDGGRPLLFLDASWRHATGMRRAVGAVEIRSIPLGWKTAYPRQSKTHEDPTEGLATVEALHAALAILGFRKDDLLAHYRWKELYLQLNAERLAECAATAAAARTRNQ